MCGAPMLMPALVFSMSYLSLKHLHSSVLSVCFRLLCEAAWGRSCVPSCDGCSDRGPFPFQGEMGLPGLSFATRTFKPCQLQKQRVSTWPSQALRGKRATEGPAVQTPWLGSTELGLASPVSGLRARSTLLGSRRWERPGPSHPRSSPGKGCVS